MTNLWVPGNSFLNRGKCPLGSLADICSAKGHVRFTPNSDRESGFPANGHVRFTPKNMCSARGHVCFGPIADIRTSDDFAALNFFKPNLEPIPARLCAGLRGILAFGRACREHTARTTRWRCWVAIP